MWQRVVNEVMAMKLVVLVAVVLTSVSGVPLNRFYPFGFEAGDNELLFEGEVNDVSSPAITLSTPFQFFGVEHETLFVSCPSIKRVHIATIV